MRVHVRRVVRIDTSGDQGVTILIASENFVVPKLRDKKCVPTLPSRKGHTGRRAPLGVRRYTPTCRDDSHGRITVSPSRDRS